MLHPNEPEDSQGRESDTGFGLSRSHHGDRGTAIMLDIRRPDSNVLEQDVEIPMEAWRITMEPSDGV